MNKIGDKVKAVRLQNKLKQVTFANKLGICQGRLSEIEQGKTKPRLKKEIAAAQSLRDAGLTAAFDEFV